MVVLPRLIVNETIDHKRHVFLQGLLNGRPELGRQLPANKDRTNHARVSAQCDVTDYQQHSQHMQTRDQRESAAYM